MAVEYKATLGVAAVLVIGALIIPGGISNPRGLAVDANDIVWFSTFVLHKLGKLDPKTGQVTMYQPPTANASPYGVLVSKKTGDVWFADATGGHITRFNPRTEQFVEYPIPTLDGYARFIGEDLSGRICFGEMWASKIGCVDPGDWSAAKPIVSD